MTTATPRTLARSTLSIDAAIARFRMTDAGSRNAFTQALKDDFAELVRVVRADAAIRAVVIEGSDGAFCAGGDLKSLAARRGPGGELLRDVEGVRLRLRESHQWFEQLVNLEVPVIAAVDGAAFGAGFSLALACDVIVATPRASFCMAFNRIGALPDLAALYTLPRMIGLRRAKDILMSARVVDAREALALGIVHSLHPSAALADVALAMARRYTQGSPAALAMTKLYVNQSLESDYPTMARLEGAGQAACLNSDYFFDAVERFLSRQPAKFGWEGLPVAGSDHSGAGAG